MESRLVPDYHSSIIHAGGLGVEPRLMRPKLIVLPLDDPPLVKVPGIEPGPHLPKRCALPLRYTLVRMRGLEPLRPFGRRVLSALRLPLRHIRISRLYIIAALGGLQQLCVLQLKPGFPNKGCFNRKWKTAPLQERLSTVTVCRTTVTEQDYSLVTLII